MLEPLQDITYTYDPVGNVTYVENPLSDVVDNAGQTVSPDFDYTYDALYRLKESQGREHPGIGQQGQEHQNNFGVFWDKTPVSDPSKITSYTESYSYDPSNNLETIDHHHGTINHPGTQIWKRTNTIAENSNRLSRSGLGGGQPTDINYDANGNQTDMAGKPLLWNYRDNIASAGMIPRTTDGPNVEYYVYDAGGSRVRKVNANQTNDAGSSTSEVVYLGNFEIRRDGTGASESEWHSIRYSDGKGVFCELRYQTQGDVPPDETNHQTCYQLTNLINSIGMEVDGTGAFISYEEYYPCGGTAFIAGKDHTAVDERRYRYSGKEQDQSGLYYYGMRYYCTWTGRWLSADPAGTVDGLNMYSFVVGNPVSHFDEDGLWWESAAVVAVVAAVAVLAGIGSLARGGPQVNTALTPSRSGESSSQQTKQKKPQNKRPTQAERSAQSWHDRQARSADLKNAAATKAETKAANQKINAAGVAAARQKEADAIKIRNEAIKARIEKLHTAASALRDREIAHHVGTVVVGAYDPRRKATEFGISDKGMHGDPHHRHWDYKLGNCAEGDAAEKLIRGGSDPGDIRFTKAARMNQSGTIDEMAVCMGCQDIFGDDRFPSNAQMSSDESGRSRESAPNPSRFGGGRARSHSPRPASWRHHTN